MTKRALVCMMLLGFGAGACSSGGSGSAAGLCSLVKSGNRNLKNATTARAASALKALAAKAPAATPGGASSSVPGS